MNYFNIEDYTINNCNIKIIRDDIFPFIGGGNKARKALEYESQLKQKGYNAIVTTGGIQSNHNRAMALLAAKNNWKCHIVYHGEKERYLREKGNALFVKNSGATVEFVKENEISTAMDNAMLNFENLGYKPYYVTGGGHDICGGIAICNAVKDLKQYCIENNYSPQYIFLPSGTGSTQSGIIAGLEKYGLGNVTVIGISIARKRERGIQAITNYLKNLTQKLQIANDLTNRIVFIDDYLFGGYELYNSNLESFITTIMKKTGLVFDTTYSGKAFYGMFDIISKFKLNNCIFWHTGGIFNTLT